MVDPTALYQAAQAALQASHNEEARRLCLQLVAAKPAFADGYFLLAIAEANIGRINYSRLSAHEMATPRLTEGVGVQPANDDTTRPPGSLVFDRHAGNPLRQVVDLVEVQVFDRPRGDRRDGVRRRSVIHIQNRRNCGGNRRPGAVSIGCSHHDPRRPVDISAEVWD